MLNFKLSIHPTSASTSSISRWNASKSPELIGFQISNVLKIFKMKIGRWRQRRMWSNVCSRSPWVYLISRWVYQRKFRVFTTSCPRPMWQSIMKLSATRLCLTAGLLVLCVRAQSSRPEASGSGDNLCTSLTTCGQCIRVADCVWCSTEVI